MKGRTIKEAAVLGMLLLAMVLLGGCVSSIEERPMADLTHSAIEVDVAAPVKDGADMTTIMATLYFLSEDGAQLVPVTREVEAPAGAGQALSVLSALLEGPDEEETDVYWPELAASGTGRFLEISGGVATVDLPAQARALPQETLYAVRLAIAMTLTEFQEISYVNVLVGGREEGLDLGATLPVGTFSRIDDLGVRDRYGRLQEQRQSSEGVTLLTTIYFPSQDGTMILPEVRSVNYAQVSPIEYLYTLLEEMGKGSNNPLAHRNVPSPMDYIMAMPEIVRTQDGYLAIALDLKGELDRELSRAGLTRGVYLAMLTDTLMGFVPGVEGVRVTIGGIDVKELDALDTVDGREVVFAHQLATRSAFDGYLGAPATLYVMQGDGLARVQHILPQARAGDARERLLGLMEVSDQEDTFALPLGLSDADILAVHVGGQEIAVNLSAAFARALSSLSERYERAAIYAMVNTLTEDTGIPRVYFFFEGEQTESLAGGLEMRGAFVRNPGMVVN